MIITSEIQKAIYNSLKLQESDNFKKLNGIFNYLDKNIDFPYIFINLNNVKDISTFLSNIYSCSFSISIFDKNTTNTFILSLADEIKTIFKNLKNFEIESLEIVDIKFNNFKIELETNNTIWQGELEYEIIVKK